MRLAEFIERNIEPILMEWEGFARSLVPGATMTPLALRNDAEAILRATVHDMRSDQSLAEQASKSRGHGGAGGVASDHLDHASTTHGAGRVGSGFDIMEVAAEYRALRASVLRLWRESRPNPDAHDIADITRFNESVDQSLSHAIGSYTRRIEQTRRLFMGILSHDLRNPLNCIRVAAGVVARHATDPDIAESVSMIESNADVIARLISDLIDFSASRLGAAMPLAREFVNLDPLCREIVQSFRSTHPDRSLQYTSSGELTGHWDAARLRQLISNLLGNALQHGSTQAPVELTAAAEDGTVMLQVRNQGDPIPAHMLNAIFDPLVRHATPETAHRRPPGSIGLGLYIVREIAVAHGGSVEVASTHDTGTTFTVRLPRRLHPSQEHPPARERSA